MGEGPTSKGREGIGGKGRGKGEEGRGEGEGKGGSVVLLGGGLTPLTHKFTTQLTRCCRKEAVVDTLILQGCAATYLRSGDSLIITSFAVRF